MTWRGHRIRSVAYDRIFKRFYYGTFSAYRDQYQMFGNPIVMPTKILWDYLVYWSITGFIFFHDRICHLTMYLRNLGRLGKLGEVNHFMQDFFRRWHAATQNQEATGCVDISQMPIIREMNARLKEQLSGNSFFERFDLNLKQLQTLACEIVEASGLPGSTAPFDSAPVSLVRQSAFSRIFDSTKSPELIATS